MVVKRMENLSYRTLIQSGYSGFRSGGSVQSGNGVLQLLMASVALILLGIYGISVVMAWMPSSSYLAGVVFARDKSLALSAKPGNRQAQIQPAKAESDARDRRKCSECGVVVSTREINHIDAGIDSGAAGGVVPVGQIEREGRPSSSHEVKVRMNDGSIRVFMAANSANWRLEERVILIEGTSRPHD